MKKAIVLLSLLFVLLLVDCTPTGESIINGATDTTQFYTYDKSDYYTVGEFAQTTEEIETIKINWINGTVTLQGEDRSGITVREDYRPKEGYEPYSVHTYVDAENKTLYIKFMRVNLRISTSVPTKNLTITLPEDFNYKKIDISTSTASGTITNIKCLDFAFQSGGIGAGMVTKNCLYKSFFSNVTAGDTVIEDCTFSEKTEYVMGTGSMLMKNCQTVLLKGVCRTGDLVLQDTYVKKATTEISMTGDGFISGLSTEDFDLDCATGNIYINLDPEMTEYTLDCKAPTISYPDNYQAAGTNVIRLHSTTGKIKFTTKTEVEKLISNRK